MRLVLEGALHTGTARPAARAEPNSAAPEMPFNLRRPRPGSLWYSCLSVKGRWRMSLHPLTSGNYTSEQLRTVRRPSAGSGESTVLEEENQDRLASLSTDFHPITGLEISRSLMMWLSEPESPAGESGPGLGRFRSGCGDGAAGATGQPSLPPAGLSGILEIYYHCIRKTKERQENHFVFPS